MTNRLRHTWRDSLHNWLIHQWAGGYTSFLLLIGIAVGLVVLGFATLFRSLAAENMSFWGCVQRAFFSFVTLDSSPGLCPGRYPFIDSLLEMALLFLALFFFAAVVAYFTALVVRPKKLFHFKSSLNIVRDSGGCHELVCSVYAAPVTVTGLGVRIIARVSTDKQTTRNIVIREHSPGQPLAEAYIPLRLRAKLGRHGIRVAGVDGNNKITRMLYHDARQGRELEVTEFHVAMSGVMADVDQGVYAEHRYIVAEGCVYLGKHASVVPDYGIARSNSAWLKRRPPPSLSRDFERNSVALAKEDSDCCYVFGYGSLVNPASFAKTLQRQSWTGEDFPLARLKGWRRTWNVAMDNRKAIPGYKQYFVDDGETPPTVFITYLNIEKSGDGHLLGVLARVNTTELKQLIKRERNYRLLDVTEDMTDAPCCGKVYAFIGRDEARDRFERAWRSGTAVVSRNYLDAVENAFRQRGRSAWENYLQTTDHPDTLGLIVCKLVRRPVTSGQR